jgi:hypothetical protein
VVVTLKSNNLGFYTLFCFSSFFTQFRVLSSFAESASGIRVLSSFAESAFYPQMRNPLPESAFYPHLRNPLTESASAIRIPVPRFIPTHGQINVLSVALPQKAGHLKVYVFIVGYTFFIVHACTIGLNSVFRGPKLDLRQYNIAI